MCSAHSTLPCPRIHPRRSTSVIPRVCSPRVSTTTPSRAPANSSGSVTASTAQGSCNAATSRRRVERANIVEVGTEEPRTEGPEAVAERTETGHERVVDGHLVGEIEAAHQDARRAAAQHDVGRLGIEVDVELGRGRHVAERAASHDRDAGDAVREAGIALQRERHVRERSRRDDPYSGDGPRDVEQVCDRVVGNDGAREHGQHGTGQSGFAVHVLGVAERVRPGGERRGGAGMYRHVDVEELQHPERVARGALETHVAGHGGDAEQLRPVRGDGDRDGIVMAGVAVEDHR